MICFRSVFIVGSYEDTLKHNKGGRYKRKGETLLSFPQHLLLLLLLPPCIPKLCYFHFYFFKSIKMDDQLFSYRVYGALVHGETSLLNVIKTIDKKNIPTERLTDYAKLVRFTEEYSESIHSDYHKRLLQQQQPPYPHAVKSFQSRTRTVEVMLKWILMVEMFTRRVRDFVTSPDRDFFRWVTLTLSRADEIKYILTAHQNWLRDTTFLVAALEGNLDVLQALLEKGVDVNVRNANGETALMVAASAGHVESVNYLISARAAIHPSDNSGKTARMRAEEKGHVEIVKVLDETCTHATERTMQLLVHASGCGNAECPLSNCAKVKECALLRIAPCPGVKN